MGRVDPTLPVRRDLKRLRGELHKIAEEKVRKRLVAKDPALYVGLAAQAELEALRLRRKHRFLLGRMAPVIFDLVELMLLARRLRGEPEQFADELALILGHPERVVRLESALQRRHEALVAEIIEEQAQ